VASQLAAATWNGVSAVREAVSLSADEALAQKVIDLTARDVPELRRSSTAQGDDRCRRAHPHRGAQTITVEADGRAAFSR
jgi:membrane-bound serine protease (ClpP class)